jgi:hypothetical protein
MDTRAPLKDRRRGGHSPFPATKRVDIASPTLPLSMCVASPEAPLWTGRQQSSIPPLMQSSRRASHRTRHSSPVTPRSIQSQEATSKPVPIQLLTQQNHRQHERLVEHDEIGRRRPWSVQRALPIPHRRDNLPRRRSNRHRCDRPIRLRSRLLRGTIRPSDRTDRRQRGRPQPAIVATDTRPRLRSICSTIWRASTMPVAVYSRMIFTASSRRPRRT